MALRLLNRDSTLVDSFLNGELRAFDTLVARHKLRVYSLVYRMTGDREWAEDITVAVFVEAYQSLVKYKRRASFSTWLHRIAVNVCLEHLRRSKAKRRIDEVPLDGREIPCRTSPYDTVLSKELADRVVTAMQTLPEAQRAAVTLYYLEERSQAEIARILGIPKNTVKTRIFYGTRALRDELRAQAIVPQGYSGEV